MGWQAHHPNEVLAKPARCRPLPSRRPARPARTPRRETPRKGKPSQPKHPGENPLCGAPDPAVRARSATLSAPMGTHTTLFCPPWTRTLPRGAGRSASTHGSTRRKLLTSENAENPRPQYIRAAPTTPGGSPLASLPVPTGRARPQRATCGQPDQLWTTARAVGPRPRRGTAPRRGQRILASRGRVLACAVRARMILSRLRRVSVYERGRWMIAASLRA